jgi:hypothetical protein
VLHFFYDYSFLAEDLKYSLEKIATTDRSVAKRKSQQILSVGLSYIFQ